MDVFQREHAQDVATALVAMPKSGAEVLWMATACASGRNGLPGQGSVGSCGLL